ncbi:MAG: RluA family pseudouridine synthase [Pseudanabaenaceae cyanobacterium bins.68]|nr:RluA family pseudouridine synthase [Pseudanabaenaceae cyanobacterium bins.68]
MTSYQLTAQLELDTRIDRYLAEQLPQLSRAYIQKLIEQGQVWLNDHPCLNKKSVIKTGDRLQVEVPPVLPLVLTAQAIPLDILYEDQDLIVINKPIGLVVHPAPGHQDSTLVNALLAHCPHLSGINGVARPGIVHRLDKDTSGAIVVAKNDLAHQGLQAQIQAKTAVREYLGIVQGIPKLTAGTINQPIGRHPRDRQKMAVIPQGRPAITHWQLQERFANYALLQFRLETGRTHQIRVHAAHMGHPIAGDPVYGRELKQLPGQALHAWRLSFRQPISGELICAIAPLPEPMVKFLALHHSQLRI